LGFGGPGWPDGRAVLMRLKDALRECVRIRATRRCAVAFAFGKSDP